MPTPGLTPDPKDIDGKAVAGPASFAELSSLDGDNQAEDVDFEDATRTLTRYLAANMKAVIEGKDEKIGDAILAAPFEHRVVGTDEVIKGTNRVFPDQPDLRYIKFMLPAISMLFLGTSKDEYWAG